MMRDGRPYGHTCPNCDRYGTVRWDAVRDGIARCNECGWRYEPEESVAALCRHCVVMCATYRWDGGSLWAGHAPGCYEVNSAHLTMVV